VTVEEVRRGLSDAICFGISRLRRPIAPHRRGARGPEPRHPGTLTNAESAREWLLDFFEEYSGAPQTVRDVEAAAQEAGRWYTKGTFERARELAGVESLPTAQLKTILGDEYDWLASEDRPPRARWVARRGVTPQLPTE
jgi:hypothetical protein